MQMQAEKQKNARPSQRKVERSSSPAAGRFEILRDDALHIGGKGGKAPVKSEKTGDFRHSPPF
jgi:hypothetical protein